MKIRLCPYCDQEMKKQHRCDQCHSFVWKANEVDIHYNPQERELSEKDCSYEKETYPQSTEYSKPEAKKKNSYTYKKTYSQTTQMPGSGRTTQKKKSRVGIIIAVIVIAVNTIPALVQSCSRSSVQKVSRIFQEDENYDDNQKTASDYISETVAHEAVIAAGTECTGYEHFDISGKELEAIMGLETPDYTDEYNSTMSWGNENITYYNMYDGYSTDAMDIQIEMDTVSRKLHEVLISGSDQAGVMLMFLRAAESVCPDMDDVQRNELNAIFQFEGDQDYKFVDVGDVEIYSNTYDAGNNKTEYMISISKVR